MDCAQLSVRWLAQEAQALESRLALVPRFSATIPMVAEAAPSTRALQLADSLVSRSKRALHRDVTNFTLRVSRRSGTRCDVPEAQRVYQILRNRFDALQTTVDIFADALTQRAEVGVGPILRGLDVLAQDGLRTHPQLYETPPVVCYLDRGIGGAIRRVFTNLPGGGSNGVALVRIPRERLCGNGLASLLHEVGHQGSALLDLPRAYTRVLLSAVRRGQLASDVGRYWITKISEVLADAWACAKLGAAGTLGLFAVLGRTPRFTFHDEPTDPHPMPWIRGCFSVAFGAAAMPHSLWAELGEMWRTLYPVSRAGDRARTLLGRIVPSIDTVARFMAEARLPELGGRSLPELLGADGVASAAMSFMFTARLGHLGWLASSVPPCTALAIVGIGRYRESMTPMDENVMISRLAREWAKRG